MGRRYSRWWQRTFAPGRGGRGKRRRKRGTGGEALRERAHICDAVAPSLGKLSENLGYRLGGVFAASRSSILVESSCLWDQNADWRVAGFDRGSCAFAVVMASRD